MIAAPIQLTRFLSCIGRSDGSLALIEREDLAPLEELAEDLVEKSKSRKSSLRAKIAEFPILLAGLSELEDLTVLNSSQSGPGASWWRKDRDIRKHFALQYLILRVQFHYSPEHAAETITERRTALAQVTGKALREEQTNDLKAKDWKETAESLLLEERKGELSNSSFSADDNDHVEASR